MTYIVNTPEGLSLQTTSLESANEFARKHGGTVQAAVAPVSAVAHQATFKQSRDKAQYVRQQKGHSLILHLTLGIFVLWIPAIYISVSPNHYWHA